MSDVAAFLAGIDEKQRRDARTLCALLSRVTGETPAMWGASIVGFGRYHYRYESGREGESALVGFSPRAKELVLYLMADAAQHGDLLKRLGKHKAGKGCLYFKSLEGVDLAVLEELAAASVAQVRALYPEDLPPPPKPRRPPPPPPVATLKKR
jgi:hypothetical protein